MEVKDRMVFSKNSSGIVEHHSRIHCLGRIDQLLNDLNSSLFLYPDPLSYNSAFYSDSGNGHVTSFGQWAISMHHVKSGLKELVRLILVAFVALLLPWEHTWIHL